MWCFYSEYIKIVYFSLWCSLEKQKPKSDSETFSSSRAECVWRRKRKGGWGEMWIWIVEMREYYEIFHWTYPHPAFVLLGYSFFCCCCWCLDCLRKRKASKIWASRSFAPHKHAHTMERNFHLFYSLTKLTSNLFLPFYSNIIKAVKRAKVSEREPASEDEQFASVYHFGRAFPPCVCLCTHDVCGSVVKE